MCEETKCFWSHRNTLLFENHELLLVHAENAPPPVSLKKKKTEEEHNCTNVSKQSTTDVLHFFSKYYFYNSVIAVVGCMYMFMHRQKHIHMLMNGKITNQHIFILCINTTLCTQMQMYYKFCKQKWRNKENISYNSHHQI